MTAIAASSVSLKTMMDGTLRISFDFEPTQAQDAFKLFAAPGTQVAIAALKAGSYIEQQAQPEKAKGGELARLAGIWCNDVRFVDWINASRNLELIGSEQAAEWVRECCQVESRAEIDLSQNAKLIFHDQIRIPFGEYLKTH